MKKVLGGLGCVSLLVFLLVGAFAQAATATAPKRVATPRYDPSKEITLEGNVTSVKKYVPGNLTGGHMFVATSKGIVDGHLGPFALNGEHRISVSAGEHVKMVGVMTTVKTRQVFLVRTIDTGNNKYVIRGEHGFPLILGAMQATKNLTLVKGGAR